MRMWGSGGAEPRAPEGDWEARLCAHPVHGPCVLRAAVRSVLHSAPPRSWVKLSEGGKILYAPAWNVCIF